MDRTAIWRRLKSLLAWRPRIATRARSRRRSLRDEHVFCHRLRGHEIRRTP